MNLLRIGKNLINKQFDVLFIGIKDFANPSLYKKYNFSEISITSFSKILKKLQKEKIDEIIMVGKISRPSIRDINFDLTINIQDIILLISFIIYDVSWDYQEFVAADFNSDGSIDVLDVVEMVNLILDRD